MPLQTTNRPTKLEDFYGNKELKEALESLLKRPKDIPHSFLFTGPSGCGKTTLAKILKTKLNCDDYDFQIYNASNTRGIDTVRKIEEIVHYAPEGKNRVIVLEECHMLTKPAQEAMLLLLEEPIKSTFFILCTTDPQQLKETLKRRCHSFQVRPLDKAEMGSLLINTLQTELEPGATYPEEIIDKIISVSNGSAGIAMKFLDMVIDMEDIDSALSIIENETWDDKEVIDLCRQLMTNDKNKWEKAKEILKDMKGEPESIRLRILQYFNKVALSNNSYAGLTIGNYFTENYYDSGKMGLIISCYQACQEE